MKLVPYDKANVRMQTTMSDILKTLEEFASSKYDCVKIEDFPHKDAKSCYGSFHHAIQRYNMSSIRVFVRGENVFLIRSDK